MTAVYKCEVHGMTIEIDHDAKTRRITHGPGQVKRNCRLLRELDPQPGTFQQKVRGLHGQETIETCQIVAL